MCQDVGKPICQYRGTGIEVFLRLEKVRNTEGQLIDQLLLSRLLPRCVLAGDYLMESWLGLEVAWINKPSAY